jgi:predicted nucleic acid-binding protein
MNVLIDTNVILDYVLLREPFVENSRLCIERLISEKAKIWLTASTITDIYYVSRKALSSAAAAKDIVATLINAFQIASVDKADCQNALEIDSGDYEDALVSVCAKRAKAEWIITRNIGDFAVSPVPAITPEDFLNEFFA